MPREMRVFNLYRISDWNRMQRTGKSAYAIGTTYAKSVKDAKKTFESNREGDFIIEHDGFAEVITLGDFQCDYNIVLDAGLYRRCYSN